MSGNIVTTRRRLRRRTYPQIKKRIVFHVDFKCFTAQENNRHVRSAGESSRHRRRHLIQIHRDDVPGNQQ